MEDVKFLCNEVNSANENELLLVGSSNGLALIKDPSTSLDPVDFVINRKLVYDYDAGSLSGNILAQDKVESVIIPKSDIDPVNGKEMEIEVDHVYRIKAGTETDPVKIYDPANSNEHVGTLKSGTILVTKGPQGPELVFAHGAGEVHHHDPIGALQLDTITLYRDEQSGEFRYYFSNNKGEVTSNTDLKNYCKNPKNCKMKD